MISRRNMLAGMAGLALVPAGGQAAGQTAGLVPDAPEDQSAALQQALQAAAGRGQMLRLAPGRYRVGGLWLPPGAELAGAPGAVLEAVDTRPLLTLDGLHGARLSGLGFRGSGAPGAGPLVEVADSDLALSGCTFEGAGAVGLSLFRSAGQVRDCRFAGCDSAITALEGRDLLIAGNTIADCANLGIYAEAGRATRIHANHITGIDWAGGGDGPNGNAINAYRARDVIITGNVIDDCAFSAVRLNACENAIVSDNLCTRLREVAIFAEFGFQGALIAGNIVEDAATGIAITNFDAGGRRAICRGNIVRAIRPASPTNPDTTPVGISAEADTIIAANLVEDVPGVGIALGWGPYLRGLSATGNLLRGCAVGIGISVVEGVAGPCMVQANQIALPPGGVAIAGMAWDRVSEPGLKAAGHPWLVLAGNQVVAQ